MLTKANPECPQPQSFEVDKIKFSAEDMDRSRYTYHIALPPIFCSRPRLFQIDKLKVSAEEMQVWFKSAANGYLMPLISFCFFLLGWLACV